MPRNKPRLQLALYTRPKHPGTYHYALFVSPKFTRPLEGRTATKHHVKNTLQNISGELRQPWRYERIAISDVRLEHRLLVRVVIAKIISVDTLERTLEGLPIYQIDDSDQMKAQSFNCLAWVGAALEALGEKGVLAGLGDWDWIQRRSLEYVEGKNELGRWSANWPGEVEVPVLDLLDGKEIVG
ncbi:hypothetical protein PV04_02927 [Phialophora macrospora]|uniref:Uncharacterized protein n=1 Tax=Phialophora macrospora TaxID=1851006 RepID=A0A0D2E8P5_9EURO|nr:hypothetical protein PV04_02927 [Phialophora macrospora]